MPRKSKTTLTVVSPNSAQWPRPPRDLGGPGQALWDRVMREYAIEDSGGIEMLAQACQQLTRAERLRERIDADGEVIYVRNVARSHPGIRDEIASRSFVVRTLQKLGLNYEPVRSSVGRPAGGTGWRLD